MHTALYLHKGVLMKRLYSLCLKTLHHPSLKPGHYGTCIVPALIDAHSLFARFFSQPVHGAANTLLRDGQTAPAKEWCRYTPTG